MTESPFPSPKALRILLLALVAIALAAGRIWPSFGQLLRCATAYSCGP